jgi:hypothetical protein
MHSPSRFGRPSSRTNFLAVEFGLDLKDSRPVPSSLPSPVSRERYLSETSASSSLRPPPSPSARPPRLPPRPESQLS